MNHGNTPPRRSVVVWALLRTTAVVCLLVVVYFLGPLDDVRLMPEGLALAIAVAILVVIGLWQVKAIAASDHPGLRGVEALAVTVPMYLLLFAATYYAMGSSDADSFNIQGLTRVDTLYFAVTTFSSVGFGDIFAASQEARLLVTLQMILNLLVLGAGVRVFVGAVRRRRDAKNSNQPIVFDAEE